MEAIRNGAQGIQDLPDHVEKMFDDGGPIPANQFDLTHKIIGLLSRPKFLTSGPGPRPGPGPTRAEVWAISGPATSKGAKAKDFGFKYLLTSEIAPINTIGLPPGAPTPEKADLDALQEQQNHLHEIRLTFRWPVLGTTVGTAVRTGPGRLVFRSLVSGTYTNNGNYYYFLPRPYERLTP